jgi:AraC-like DNA-binding protein
VIPNAHFVEELVLNAEKEYKKNTTYANEIAESYLKCALLKLAEYDNQRRNDLYTKITNYIFCNFRQIKSNNDVDKALGYHPFYLSKVIGHHSGLTLHQYIRKFRLTKEIKLLTFTDMSIAEISIDIGINTKQFL